MKPKFIIFLVILFIYSCSDKQPNIGIVSESCKILRCEKIFADDLKAIEERNEILLQTGLIDTTDEQRPIRTAVINIDKNEILLTFEKSDTVDQERNEIYKGNGYNLTLIYRMTKNKFDHPIYNGKFILENSTSKREIKVEGRSCNL